MGLSPRKSTPTRRAPHQAQSPINPLARRTYASLIRLPIVSDYSYDAERIEENNVGIPPLGVGAIGFDDTDMAMADGEYEIVWRRQ
jgi:hypothetical protein